MALVDGILERLEPFIYKRTDSSPEIQMWCPFCGDRESHTHGHLYLNRISLKYRCVYCGRGSDDISSLLKAYNVTLSYVDKVTLQFSGSSNVKVVPSKIDSSPALAAFTKESRPLKEGSWGYEYLAKKRGMQPSDIARYWREWDHKPGYVFWFTTDEHQNPIFFSGRAYLKGLEPKYYHLSTTPPVVLFHPSAFVPTPAFSGKSLVFLVEGIFDAFFAPGPAIPLFSKNMSNKMQAGIKRMILMNNLSPVSALDKDEVDDNVELASLLHTWCEETYLFKMAPCKDFGENKMSSLSNADINRRLLPFSPHVKSLLSLQLMS